MRLYIYKMYNDLDNKYIKFNVQTSYSILFFIATVSYLSWYSNTEDNYQVILARKPEHPKSPLGLEQASGSSISLGSSSDLDEQHSTMFWLDEEVCPRFLVQKAEQIQ